MLIVETIANIRRFALVQGMPIKAICRELGISRKVVRKVLRTEETEFKYERVRQPQPKLGPWLDELDGMLLSNEAKPSRERLTLIRMFEDLRDEGYDGGYDAVRRYARKWSQARGSATAEAYVPLYYAPGEAYQFDWSHEIVVLNGVTTTVKVAHVRLCHSRMMYVRAYPRETQEMVFDAHDRAFAFFGGACTRGIYDNMKTAVETVFVGKERQYNRRFVQMCSHFLVEPVACTPASGWEKGQVENQVNLVRERFFTPTLRFKSYDELNAWLADRCMMHARAMMHPEFKDRTVWDVYQDEKPSLMQLPATAFDGFHALPAAVSKTLLVRFDYNTVYGEDRRILRYASGRLAYGLLVAALVVAPLVLPRFYIGELTYIFIVCIASLGTMVLIGYTGQVSLGTVTSLAFHPNNLQVIYAGAGASRKMHCDRCRVTGT